MQSASASRACQQNSASWPQTITPHAQNAPVHARAPIIVTSSDAKSYDEAGPRLRELRLNETFAGNIEARVRFGLYRSKLSAESLHAHDSCRVPVSAILGNMQIVVLCFLHNLS